MEAERFSFFRLFDGAKAFATKFPDARWKTNNLKAEKNGEEKNSTSTRKTIYKSGSRKSLFAMCEVNVDGSRRGEREKSFISRNKTFEQSRFGSGKTRRTRR